jgi:hypothetical protein
VDDHRTAFGCPCDARDVDEFSGNRPKADAAARGDSDRHAVVRNTREPPPVRGHFATLRIALQQAWFASQRRHLADVLARPIGDGEDDARVVR